MGSHVPGSVWPAVVAVCGGWMVGRLEMGMWLRVLTGSCCVAASVVAVRAGGRGVRDCIRHPLPIEGPSPPQGTPHPFPPNFPSGLNTASSTSTSHKWHEQRGSVYRTMRA